jgi:hypothetical protein
MPAADDALDHRIGMVVNMMVTAWQLADREVCELNSIQGEPWGRQGRLAKGSCRRAAFSVTVQGHHMSR